MFNSAFFIDSRYVINMQKPNIVKEKSFAFALRIITVARYLQEEKREFVLSKQVLRSGTAIGALIREAEHAQSRPDFINKMSVALKEANETDYWIELLYQAELITKASYDELQPAGKELIKLLAAIVKTTKS